MTQTFNHPHISLMADVRRRRANSKGLKHHQSAYKAEVRRRKGLGLGPSAPRPMQLHTPALPWWASATKTGMRGRKKIKVTLPTLNISPAYDD